MVRVLKEFKLLSRT